MLRRLNYQPKTPSFHNAGKALLTFAVVAFLGFVMSTPGWAQQDSLGQAVEMARTGRIDEALVALEKLYAQDPQDMSVFHDYLTVLSWAGQDDRVAKLSARFSPETGPGYVVAATAKSARRRGDYQQAEHLYRIGLQRFPNDHDFAHGLIMTLADAGQNQAALELSRQLEQRYPGEPSLLLARGYALERERDFFAALKTYDQTLSIDPGNRLAKARRIMVIDSLGASHLAVDLARADPGLLSPDEHKRILGNQGAFAVRWGELPPENEAQRFVQTDRALALLDRNRTELDHTQPTAQAFELRTRRDRLVALRNRFRMNEVISDYESLRKEDAAQPGYVLSAAADAYRYLQQPELAKALYTQILGPQPEDFTARVGLFYTLIDLEDYAAAYAVADNLDQAESPWLEERQVGEGRPLPRPNPQKLTADITAAMARVYGEQYAEAEKRLTALHDAAPANLEVIRELGNVYSARGWPRKAQQTYSLGLGLAPRDKNLQIGMAQSYLERRDYRLAEQMIDRLYSLYPEDPEVRKLNRSWDTYNRFELRLAAGYWDNSGATQGTRETLIEGALFSRPLAYNYRLFVASHYAFAAFPEGDENYWREGVGLEYRRPDLEAIGELTYNHDGGDKIGGRLALLWELDDHWSFPVKLELFSRETPLRALKNGATADSADLGITYRFSELRSLSLKGQIMNFSDGNFRRSLSADMEQRLLTFPTYKLMGIVDLYTSANSRDDVIYFNPGHDFSAGITLDNLHRLYRRCDLSFSQRLALTGGNYWQKGFDDDYFAGAVYEHIWDTNDRFSLVYGLSRFRRIFDGLPEYHDYFYARLNWRF